MASPRPLSWAGKLIALWGIAGVLALLGQAIVRLAPLALEPLRDHSMSTPQWGLYAAWTLFNAYAEGYRGFQKAFAPRVVARAVHLGHHPRPLHVLLAPMFCMAMFHAKKKNLILAWGLLTGIILLVTAVRMLPQPWRGIVDGGVVVGLLWGVVSIVVMFACALMTHVVPPDESLPPSRTTTPLGADRSASR